MPYFTARLVEPPESQPEGKCLYETVTPGGERVASALSEWEVQSLADKLNETMAQWAYLAGPKAVAEGG